MLDQSNCQMNLTLRMIPQILSALYVAYVSRIFTKAIAYALREVTKFLKFIS